MKQTKPKKVQVLLRFEVLRPLGLPLTMVVEKSSVHAIFLASNYLHIFRL